MSAVLAGIVLALGVVACGGDDDEGGGGGGAAKQTVKVGGIFDLTGATADVGVPYADGVKGYVAQHNKQGDGPKIELISEDYKYDVAVAERLYSRLKSEGVVAIQGWGTGDTEALRGRITADRLPFMSASYSAALADPAETPFNFVAGTTYSDQLKIALNWIADKSPSGTQVAVFHHDSPFGESPLKDGSAYNEEQNLGLGVKAYAMPAEATDYVSQLQRAKAQGAKYVVIQNVSSPAAQLAKNIKQEAAGMQVICLNWCGDELFGDLAGSAAEGAMAVMPFAPASSDAPGLQAPRSYLQSTGGNLDEKGVHYVQGWYTMAVMAQGIARAGEKGDVSGDSLKAALQDMGAFDTKGVSAPIEFTADSHAGMAGAKLYEVKGGKWTQLTDVQRP